MAGRFRLLADEHWSKAHIKAARETGWEVLRVVDVLRHKTEDPELLAYCAAHGCVWITSDEHAMGHVTAWLSAGKTLPGVIIVPQRTGSVPAAWCASSSGSLLKTRPSPASSASWHRRNGRISVSKATSMNPSLKEISLLLRR